MPEVIRGKSIPLYRRTKKQKLLPIATFDIETKGMGGDYLDGCIYYGEEQYLHFSTPEELMQWMFDHPGYRYYAHNGGGYDFSYLMDYIIDHITPDMEVAPIVQGNTRLIGMIFKDKKKKKRFELRDSLALIPMALKKAAKAFAPHLPKLDIGLARGTTYDPLNPIHVEYLHRDCLSLFEVVKEFERIIFELFGTTIGFTAGSTAMNAWVGNIPEGHVYYRMHPDIEDWVRQGYYGGYVFPGFTIKRHRNVKGVDMNAAYSAIMIKNGVPVGTPAYVGPDDYKKGLPGIYEVIAHVPKDTPFPMIPSRQANGNLQWATGHIKTIVTSLEIEFAQQHGVTFDILCGYVWSRIEYPFTDFLRRCEYLETTQPETKEAIKVVRNSLYGKFGMNPTGTTIAFNPSGDFIVDTVPLVNETTGSFNPYVIAREEWNNASYINPHWAAWITAGQRIALLSLFYTVGHENVYYGDTDCVIGDAARIDQLIARGELEVSKLYGGVKVETELDTFIALGPKNYHGITIDGEYYGKCKGIPRPLLSIEVYLLYEQSGFLRPPEVEFDSAVGAFQKLKHPNKEIAVHRKRKLSSIYNSTSWSTDGIHITPLHIPLQMVYTSSNGKCA